MHILQDGPDKLMVDERFMHLGIMEAIRLTKLPKGTKVVIPEDRPYIEGEYKEPILPDRIEVIPDPNDFSEEAVKARYRDALIGIDWKKCGLTNPLKTQRVLVI